MQIGNHWIRRKNSHLFIGNISSQFHKEKVLSRIGLPADSRIFMGVMLHQTRFLAKFAKIFPLFKIKLELRIQCPNHRKWPFLCHLAWRLILNYIASPVLILGYKSDFLSFVRTFMQGYTVIFFSLFKYLQVGLILHRLTPPTQLRSMLRGERYLQRIPMEL